MRCEKIWKDRGFICFMLRNSTFDTLNGYVVIPSIHPWYKEHYDSIDAEVHGGLTFSEEIGKEWVVGFDTNHHGDAYGPNIPPEIKEIHNSFSHSGVYRNEEYVIREIEELVTQALNVCDMYEREDLYGNIDSRMAKMLLAFED